MYEPPVTLQEYMSKEIVSEIDNHIMARVGVEVNVYKDELIKALNYDREQYAKGYADAKAEFEPKQGKWTPTEYPFMNECEDCSVCGFRTAYGLNLNFCPNCGAKMT